MTSTSCTNSDVIAIAANSVTLGECLLIANKIAGVSAVCNLCSSNYFSDVNYCINTVCGFTKDDSDPLSTPCVECLTEMRTKYGDSSVCGIEVKPSSIEVFDQTLTEIERIVVRAENSTKISNAAATGIPSISIKQVVFALDIRFISHSIMPVARALACDGSDYAVLQQNVTAIDSCFKGMVYLTAGDFQECYEINGVSVSCRACAATAYQDVSDCIYTCQTESPGRLCSRCLNQIRDDYDISGAPIVCGITKEYMSDFILALFQNDKLNQLYVMNNVSTELATPSPLPVKRDFNPVSKSSNNATNLPVDADASSPSSKSSILPRKWTAIFVLSVVLLSNL